MTPPPGRVGRVVRAGRPDDAEALGALEAVCLGRDAWPASMLAQGLADQVPYLSYLVLQDGDGGDAALVGYAAVSVVHDVAELQQVGVDPDRRRTGAGRVLLAAVDDLVRAAGVDRVLLEVREDNVGARALYAAHGYVEISRRKRYYRDGATAVVLEHAL